MHLVVLVLLIILLEYFIFTMLVGRARVKTGIKAPRVSGAPELERAIRVQQNTLEQIAIVLPAMWFFGQYINEYASATLGTIFVIGRAMYCRSYMVDPEKRTAGFLIGFLATLVLLIGALIGVVLTLI